MKEIFLSFVSLFASLAFVVLFIFIGKYLCPDLYLVLSIKWFNIWKSTDHSRLWALFSSPLLSDQLIDPVERANFTWKIKIETRSIITISVQNQ